MNHPTHREDFPSHKIYAQGLAITFPTMIDSDYTSFRYYNERYEVSGRIHIWKYEGEPKTRFWIMVAPIDEVRAAAVSRQTV